MAPQMARLTFQPSCQTIQNPPWLRHRRLPFSARGVGGLPLRRHSLFVRAKFALASVSFRTLGSPQISICGESVAQGVVLYTGCARSRTSLSASEPPRPLRAQCGRCPCECCFCCLPSVVFLSLDCLSWVYVHSARCHRAYNKQRHLCRRLPLSISRAILLPALISSFVLQ